MSAFDLLQGWLKPLLDPLNEVQSVIQQPMSLHQESVSEFSSLVEGLYQGPNAFEGQAADAVKAMTESYLQMEANFSGAGTLATGASAAGGVLTLPTTAVADTTLSEAATVSVECGVEITAAAATAAGEMGADAGLDAVTSAIDVAAVAQAGLDPVTDIPAAVITAIDMATKIAILVALGWSIFNAVLRWINDMNRLGHVTWPPLPSFLEPGSLSTIPSSPMNALSTEEKQKLEKVIETLKGQGVPYTQSEIIDLVKEGYTVEEIIAIIKARRLLQGMGTQNEKPFPFAVTDVNVLAKKGLNSEEIVQAILAGVSTSLSADEIRKELADLNSRIDESTRPFTLKEKSIAYYLSMQGYRVIAVPEGDTRMADAFVQAPDGKEYYLEFKTIDIKPGEPATAKRVARSLQLALHGQAQSDNILIDGRGTGLTEKDAEQGIKAKMGDLQRHHIATVRILGDSFDIIIDIP